MSWVKRIDLAIITGALLGVGGVLIAFVGNPVNSGICISCFLENLAGALQLQGELRMSYIRPELIGFVLGAFVVAKKTGRFKVTGGSSPIIRFFLGFFIIVGCAVFIGCPIKMILRLAAGDLTAVVAVVGMMFGVWCGARYIKAGVFLERERNMPRINGYIVPFLACLFLVFVFLQPTFIKQGQTGPAAMHAPVLLSLALGLILGGFSQRSGLCITGGFRNYFLFREKTLLNGVITFFITALLVSLATNQFNLGLNGQPASHMSHGWTFLAMTLVGLASVIIDGCPFRQVIKSGQGDIDAGITTVGMLAGAALVISWSMRSTSAGPEFAGKVAVMSGLILCLLVVISYRKKVKTAR
ncbi:MAG: YedE family putative selenium transporter [Thermodesulfobacteriota bacterium]|nr:YedE family putative selenium transporter [Thermodesulfobacteriota bacterium]